MKTLSGVCVERTEQIAIQTVILDAGPIIHLEEISCLPLLSDFKELLVPKAVWTEIECHCPSVLNNAALPFIEIPILENIDSPIIMLCNAFNLDEGEKQAIVLCFQHQGSILLTDDAAARLAAKSIGIKTHGTVGILLRAIRRKQLTPQEVIKHLEDIPLKSTLFLKSSLLTEIIEQVRKKYNI